jgi:hypothetical protein
MTDTADDVAERIRAEAAEHNAEYAAGMRLAATIVEESDLE